MVFVFEKVSVEQDGFFAVSVREDDFRALCVSFRVFFGIVKLMKFQQKYLFAYLKIFNFLTFSGAPTWAVPSLLKFDTFCWK